MKILLDTHVLHDLVLATEDATLHSYTVGVDGTPWRRPR